MFFYSGLLVVLAGGLLLVFRNMLWRVFRGARRADGLSTYGAHEWDTIAGLAGGFLILLGCLLVVLGH